MTQRLKVYVLSCPEDHSQEIDSKCKGVLEMQDLETSNFFMPMFRTEEEAFKASLPLIGGKVKQALLIVDK